MLDRVKSSGVRQSKISKSLLGIKGLKEFFKVNFNMNLMKSLVTPSIGRKGQFYILPYFYTTYPGLCTEK